MKKLAIAVAALLLLVVLAWRWIGGSEGIVAAPLAEFPDYPEPTRRLTDERGGKVYFATSTPFDFDVILAAPELARPATGLGDFLAREL